MKPGRLLPYALVLAAAFPALVYTLDPAARDQGVFALIGWRWFHGDVPYLSAGMEHKGPLPFLAYGIAFLLFGHSFFAARLLAWLALLVAGWGLVSIGRALDREDPARGDAAGAAAGMLYVLITGLGGLSAWWSGAQAEAFMEPFTVWAVAVFLRAGAPGSAGRAGGSSRSMRAVFAAGALLGIASLGKPTVLLLAPVFLLAGSGLTVAAALLAGIVTPWLLTLGWFAAHHAAAALIESVFLANVDYGARGLRLIHGTLPRFLRTHDMFISLRFAAPALVGAAALWRGRRPAVSRLLFGWAVVAYLEVIAQGRLFGYHFYPIVAPFSLLAALGFVAAARAVVRPRPAWFRAAAAVVLAVGISGVLSFNRGDWLLRWERATGRLPAVAFLRSFASSPEPSDVDPYETFQAARWAADRLRPDQTLLVWGFEPAVNFLARRRSPTRFIYDYFLTSKSVPPERQRHYWDLFWQDLAAHPPDWIAVVHNDRNPLEPEDSATQLLKEPRLRAYLEQNYESEARVGDFEFYRRVPPD